MLLHQSPRATDARRDDARARILLETLRVEHAALAAVEGEHCLVGRESSKCRADDLLAYARRLRVALHLGEESREAAAALRGERRCRWRHNRGCKRKPGSAKACHHETGAHPLTSLSSRRVLHVSKPFGQVGTPNSTRAIQYGARRLTLGLAATAREI